jgi:hypothetical protein
MLFKRFTSDIQQKIRDGQSVITHSPSNINSITDGRKQMILITSIMQIRPNGDSNSPVLLLELFDRDSSAADTVRSWLRMRLS